MTGHITSTTRVLVVPPGSTEPRALFNDFVLHTNFFQLDRHVNSRKASSNNTDVEIFCRNWQRLVTHVVFVDNPNVDCEKYGVSPKRVWSPDKETMILNPQKEEEDCL